MGFLHGILCGYVVPCPAWGDQRIEDRGDGSEELQKHTHTVGGGWLGTIFPMDLFLLERNLSTIWSKVSEPRLNEYCTAS